MLNPTNLTEVSGRVYYEYYEALISELSDWSYVLGSRQIDTAYFGGGTSTLMTLELMRSIFGTIPGLREVKSKSFECDPVSLTKQKIDILASYDFSYVTFGIQTLDSDELQRQNRVNATIEKLQEITEYTLQNGMAVSLDIMAFLNHDSDQDLKRVETDLHMLCRYVRPTAIDIYPTMPNLEGDASAVLPRVTALRALLFKITRSYSEYQLAEQRYLEMAESVTMQDRYRNYFLVRMDPNEYFREVKSYSCSDPLTAPVTQNTIGFGGYGKREVYSYLDRKEVCYWSHFDAASKLFIYY